MRHFPVKYELPYFFYKLRQHWLLEIFVSAICKSSGNSLTIVKNNILATCAPNNRTYRFTLNCSTLIEFGQNITLVDATCLYTLMLC